METPNEFHTILDPRSSILYPLSSILYPQPLFSARSEVKSFYD